MLKPLVRPELARFIVVGLLSAGLYFGICYALRQFANTSAFSSSLAAYVPCFCVAYLGQRNYTFRSTDSFRLSLAKYAFVQACLGLMVSFATEWLSKISDLPPLHLALFATGFAGICSFFVSASWIFPNR